MSVQIPVGVPAQSYVLATIQGDGEAGLTLRSAKRTAGLSYDAIVIRLSGPVIADTPVGWILLSAQEEGRRFENGRTGFHRGYRWSTVRAASSGINPRARHTGDGE